MMHLARTAIFAALMLSPLAVLLWGFNVPLIDVWYFTRDVIEFGYVRAINMPLGGY